MLVKILATALAGILAFIPLLPPFDMDGGLTDENVGGTWRTQPNMTLSLADGQMMGYDGCNHFGGKYTIRGRHIIAKDVISTLMFCQGPLSHPNNKALHQWFNHPSTAVIATTPITLTLTVPMGNNKVQKVTFIRTESRHAVQQEFKALNKAAQYT